MKYVIRSLQVKATPIYVCLGCKTQAEGRTVTRDILGMYHHLHEALSILGNVDMLFTNQHMPVGWEGEGNNHWCDKCSLKRNSR